MADAEIFLIRKKSDLEKAFAIRRTVFVEEQGIDPKIELDKYEPNCKHFLILYQDKPVGACRIRLHEGKAKLQRLAVLKEYRGLGLGKLGINTMVKYCKRRKIKEIYMNAQHYLKDYYSKLGFTPVGEIFEEARIKHMKMVFTGNF